MVLSASGTISRNSFLRIVRFMAISLCWAIVSSPLRFDTGENEIDGCQRGDTKEGQGIKGGHGARTGRSPLA
jgi:hypothetical protein